MIVLQELLNISNFFSIDHGLPKTRIICFSFQTMENDWIWRIFFERFVTIVPVSVVMRVLSFQPVPLFQKLDCKFKSFFTEKLKYLNYTLMQYMHLFILN